jgi:hypothetical protein
VSLVEAELLVQTLRRDLLGCGIENHSAEAEFLSSLEECA